MRSTLWPILALFLALHALYNWATPLGEGPDEPGHLAYAIFLAGEGRLPVQRADPEASDVPGEGHQPPMAYALAAPTVAWLPPDERTILLTANPRFLWAGGDEPGAFMRFSRELWPWEGLTLAWHMARAVSGLWGALAVALTFLAARRLSPGDPWLAPIAALLVALNPQLLFTTALATNDALLAALGAACLWWCLRPAPPAAWALGAGLIFGLALLTKQSALLLGPLLLWGGRRAAGGDWRRFVGITLGWGLAALAVAGWWYWRNLALYGDPFGLGAFKAEFATQPFAWGDPAAWAGALGQLFASFWARFGWMSLRPPSWALWPYAGLCAAAALGWALALRRGRPDDGWAGPAIAVAMALAWTLAFAAAAGLVAWQGRMLFPAIGAIGLGLAAGLRAVATRHGRETPRRGIPTVVVAALVVLAAFMPLGAIRPGYTWVALAPREALAGLGSTTYARFAASWERGVELRGWRLEGSAAPGAALPLTLTWHSLEPVPRPWTVFVHLVAADETIVAQSNRQPRGDTLPFPLWTPGDWVQDTHRLDLPADLPPGEYRLRVGLFRADGDGRRQRVWGEDGGELGSYAELGLVSVGR
ncbi:MAG TPA: glycosyltransferase family 39 protein [Chloroflexaceae bacterium]|nr:glycosyltransferase family 39 protein [Chloroflexaceae bacterium]